MMKGTSYLIMWLTLFLVVVLAMVLGLVFLLLADFYFSPLLRRRRRRRRQITTPNTTDTTGNSPPTHAEPLNDIEKQLLDSPENQETGETQRRVKSEIQNGNLTDSVNGSSMVYISNPVYGDGNGTPFETPESSPSRLGTEDSSDDDEREEMSSKVVVTPMKKLPAEECFVCVKDVGSVGTSESDRNSNNGVSSCWLSTPCTSSTSL